jgi:hypothetical protein
MISIIRVEIRRPSRLLRAGFLFGSFSILEMDVIRSSETSVHKLTTWRYIPEDGNMHIAIVSIHKRRLVS